MDYHEAGWPMFEMLQENYRNWRRTVKDAVRLKRRQRGKTADGMDSDHKQRGGKRNTLKIGQPDATKDAKAVDQPPKSRSALIDALSKPTKTVNKERLSKLQEKKDEKLARKL